MSAKGFFKRHVFGGVSRSVGAEIQGVTAV